MTRYIARPPRLVFLIWLAFLTRAAFYCVEQPLWEGYDEWAHFGYIQYIAERRALPSRSDPVSGEVATSLLLAPLPRSAADGIRGAATHDSFWLLPAEERRRRNECLRGLNADVSGAATRQPLTQYEAQHPSLYYVAMAPVYALVATRSLPARVFMLRLVTAAIGSAIVFLVYGIGRRILPGWGLPLLTAALVACWPGLFTDMCRIGNDSLLIVLASCVILVCVRMARGTPRPLDWALLGTLLGAALLAKAAALALLPLVSLVAALTVLRRRARARAAIAGTALALGIAALLAGWWYWKTWQHTGSLSGEQLETAAARFTASDKAAAILYVNWRAVLDSAASTHIWSGGWSFLVARSWMYHVFECAALLAAVGVMALVVRILRNSTRRSRVASGLTVLLGAWVLMCAALAYDSAVIFIARGLSTAIGWYLYPVITAEAVLVACGALGLCGVRRAPGAMAALCLLAAAFDLYTVHCLSVPYYTGLIRHDAAGNLPAFNPATLTAAGAHETFRRLAADEPSPINAGVAAALWVAYVFATIALAALAAHVAFRRPEPVTGTSCRPTG